MTEDLMVQQQEISRQAPSLHSHSVSALARHIMPLLKLHIYVSILSSRAVRQLSSRKLPS